MGWQLLHGSWCQQQLVGSCSAAGEWDENTGTWSSGSLWTLPPLPVLLLLGPVPAVPEECPCFMSLQEQWHQGGCGDPMRSGRLQL